jgi:hypothetical protein
MALPVVEDGTCVTGIVKRSDISSTYLRLVQGTTRSAEIRDGSPG